MKPLQPKPPLPAVKKWNPKGNESDGLVQDIYDVHKTMKWITALEKKLDGTEPTDNFVSGDWEMLARLKRDMGMEVKFKTVSELKEEKRVEKSKWDQKGPVETANSTPGEVSVEDLKKKLPKKKFDKIMEERAAIKGQEPKQPGDDEEAEELQMVYIPHHNIYMYMKTPKESY